MEKSEKNDIEKELNDDNDIIICLFCDGSGYNDEGYCKYCEGRGYIIIKPKQII